MNHQQIPSTTSESISICLSTTHPTCSTHISASVFRCLLVVTAWFKVQQLVIGQRSITTSSKRTGTSLTSLHRDLCSGDVVRPCCCSQTVALLVFPLDWLFSFLCDTFIVRYLAPCGFCLVLAVVSCTVSLPLGEVHHCHCGFVLTSKNNELNSTNLIFSPLNRKKDESEFKGSISDSFSLLCI